MQIRTDGQDDIAIVTTTPQQSRNRPTLAFAIGQLGTRKRERVPGVIDRSLKEAKLTDNGTGVRVSWYGTWIRFMMVKLHDQWVDMDDLAVGPNNSVIKPPPGNPPIMFHLRIRRDEPRPFRVRRLSRQSRRRPRGADA